MGSPFSSARLHAMALIGVAAGLRLWGIDFGLPLVSNLYIRPDETLTLTAALNQLTQGGDPRMFAYPALHPWLVSVAYLIVYGARWALGMAEAGGLARDWAMNLTPYVLAARCISAVFGVATVWVAARLALAMTGARRGAWIAAWLVALAPLPVRDAHFATVDTVLTFFCAAWVLCVWRFAELQPGRAAQHLAGAALCAGLAAATKYHMGVLAPLTLALAVGANLSGMRSANAWHVPWPRLVAITVALPALAWLGFNPMLLVHPGEYLSTLRGLNSNLGVFADGALTVPLWKLLLRPVAFLRWGPGGELGVLLAAGGLWLVLQSAASRFQKLSLLSALGVLFALLAMTRYLPFRYLLPLMPLVAVLIAYWVNQQWGRHVVQRIWPVLLILFLVPAWRSAMLASRLGRTDTRTLAGEWIEAHVARGTPIVLLMNPEAEPQLAESPESITRRMAYHDALYGEHGGALTNQTHALRLPAARGDGWSVVRFPAQWPAGFETICVVTAEHTLPYGQTPPREDEALRGETVERVEIRAEDEGDIKGRRHAFFEYSFDRIDAFFLPMGELNHVERPGPDLTIEVRRRAR